MDARGTAGALLVQFSTWDQFHVTRYWKIPADIRSFAPLRTIWIAARQPMFLAALVILLGLWGFAEIADSLGEDATQQFDEMVLKSLRQPDALDQLIGPPWVEQSLRDLTALGGVTVLTMVTFIVCIYLWIDGEWKLSLFAFFAVASGTILTFALKDVFDRPRPQLVPHILVSVSSYSFPSGHAMASAIVYLTLGAMLTESQPRWRIKAYVMAVALLLTFSIGTTRVFLGVHYPTDVLAGWAGGFAWAYACRVLSRLGTMAVHFRHFGSRRGGSRGTPHSDEDVDRHAT